MIFATAGAKLYIGSAIANPHADLNVATFTSQDWVEIKHTENLGRAGDASAEIALDHIDQTRTTRLKGTRNAGAMEVICSFDSTDSGQIALIAAEKTIHDYAFRLVFNDAPAGGTPSERMFIAAVGGAEEVFDTANDSVKLQSSLWINSNIVRVAAAPNGD
ncbi:MAG: hypothetical protein JJU15_00415 [Pararhodobacter sp.]|nr:hypothetical protein [Pararhodobacter sp.]